MAEFVIEDKETLKMVPAKRQARYLDKVQLKRKQEEKKRKIEFMNQKP